MKKNNILLLIVFLFSSAFLTSCDKEFFDINSDPNAPKENREDLFLSATLANFSYETAGGYPVRVTALWTKQLAAATPTPHAGTYDIDENDVNNWWRFTSYTKVMNNSKELIKMADANGNFQYSAIAKVILAYNLAMISDLFGDVPYSEAFKGEEGNFKPTYDKQEDVYREVQRLLDEAIVDADKPSTAAIPLNPKADDRVYGGNMAKWKKLANSLKARYHLRLTNAPGYDAAEQANKALAALDAGAITTNADAPKYGYLASPSSENPWYQFAIDGKWNLTNRPSAFYLNKLQEMNDPRIAFQATKATTGPDAGKYVGAENDGGTPTAANITTVSQIHPFYAEAKAPVYFYIPAESHFIRAEAEFLKAGKTVTPAVLEAYNAGITTSMEMYGLASTDFAAYRVANTLNILNSAAAYEQIMTQKYIANYLQVEPYNDYRRTGYPTLPLNNEAVIDRIPLRFPVPSSERLYNAQNIPSNLPVGYANLLVPVWWDGN